MPIFRWIFLISRDSVVYIDFLRDKKIYKLKFIIIYNFILKIKQKEYWGGLGLNLSLSIEYDIFITLLKSIDHFVFFVVRLMGIRLMISHWAIVCLL